MRFAALKYERGAPCPEAILRLGTRPELDGRVLDALAGVIYDLCCSCTLEGQKEKKKCCQEHKWPKEEMLPGA